MSCLIYCISTEGVIRSEIAGLLRKIPRHQIELVRGEVALLFLSGLLFLCGLDRLRPPFLGHFNFTLVPCRVPTRASVN